VEGLGFWVGTTIFFETVLEEVAGKLLERKIIGRKGELQFPCTVAELGTSLADMEMEDLRI
jgi:hypothetical protein